MLEGAVLFGSAIEALAATEERLPGRDRWELLGWQAIEALTADEERSALPKGSEAGVIATPRDATMNENKLTTLAAQCGAEVTSHINYVYDTPVVLFSDTASIQRFADALVAAERQRWMVLHAQAVSELRACQSLLALSGIQNADVATALEFTGGGYDHETQNK